MKSYLAAALVLFIVSGLVFYKAYGPQKCQWRRAAFDIGSGATKIKVADVDVCEKKIIEIVYQASVKADFKSDIEKHGYFTAPTLERGIKALRALKDQTRDLSPPPEAFSAVATSAFRDSKNSHAFVKAVRESKHLGIPVFIIDQSQEARLGFFAAIGHTKKPKEQILVWDIGGGSMQMSLWNHDDLQIYEGQLAAVSFKNHIIKEIKKQNLKKIKSPNPIGKAHTAQALSYAAKTATETIPRNFKELMKNREVIGIGGVHFFSLRQQLKISQNESYNITQIAPILEERLQWADDKIQSEYAETEVSNLVLVKAFMEALDIQEVLPTNINMADGLLLEEKLWPRELFL